MAAQINHPLWHVEQHLHNARTLSRQGRHTDAISLLEQARADHKHDSDLVFEIAEIYSVQGYINRALHILDSIDVTDNVAGDMQLMLEYFLQPLQSGSFSSSLAEAERINRKYHLDGQTEPEWTRVATIKWYYYKILSLCSTFHHTVSKDHFDAAETSVLAIIKGFLYLRDWGNAFKMCISLLDGGRKSECIRSMLSMDGIPPLVEAKAKVELVSFLQGPENEQRRKDLRSYAKNILIKEHRYAALELDFEEALNDNSKSDDLIIDQLLQQYEKLDFPNGMKGCLSKLVVAAAKLHNYELQHQLENKLEELAMETGTLCLLRVQQVTQIARFHQKTGNDDLVKSTLLKFYEDLQSFDVPYTLGHVGFILTDIFIRSRDVLHASQWAETCNRYWQLCSPEAQSTGHIQLLRSRILDLQIANSSEFQDILAFCKTLVEFDENHKLYAQAAMKLDTVLDIFFTSKAISWKDRTQQIQDNLARITTLLGRIVDSDTTMQEAGILQRRATFYQMLASQESNCEMDFATLEAFKKALALIHAASTGTLTYQLVTIRAQIAIAEYTCSTKLWRADPETSKCFLHDAEKSFEACLEGFEAMHSTFQIAEMKYWIALVKYEATKRGWETFEVAMRALLNAEEGCDHRRNEINISSGINAVRDKQIIAKEKHVRDVYKFAFDLCFLEGRPAAAWQWIQKAKARSLSDTLGLNSIVPNSNLAPVLKNPTSRKLYEYEQRLFDQIKSAAPDKIFNIGLELRALQEEMQKDPLLRNLLDLRQGKTALIDELKNRMNALHIGSSHPPIAFVDWYVQGPEDIFCSIFIINSGKDPILRKLNISVSRVRQWIQEYLLVESGQEQSLHRADNHPCQALRELDNLVEIVGEQVEENVLLVLCPAAPLEALPLHALHVHGRGDLRGKRPVPLLERNPVVYCSSSTAFLQCCELARAKQPPHEAISAYMAVYEGTPAEPCDTVERSLVYATMTELSSEPGASVTTGSQVTREKVAVDWSTADRILFHGHCNFSPKDITEQSLILVRNSTDSLCPEYLDLTVRDVFDLKLQSPLVSLLACGSSQQRVEAGDEPLGLVTAFLCAGAGSVIGTLWPVASGTARLFAVTFAEQMKLASATLDRQSWPLEQVLDLAVVLQLTVRKLRRNTLTRTPYHWAAFVLHGSSLLRTR